jgi:hypothetical protein
MMPTAEADIGGIRLRATVVWTTAVHCPGRGVHVRRDLLVTEPLDIGVIHYGSACIADLSVGSQTPCHLARL